MRTIADLPEVVTVPEAELPPLRVPWGQFFLDEALCEGQVSAGVVAITEEGEVHTVGASLPSALESSEHAAVLGVWLLMRGAGLIGHDASLECVSGLTAVVGVDCKKAVEAVTAVVGPLWLRPFLMDLHSLSIMGKLVLHKVDRDIPAMQLAHHVAVRTPSTCAAECRQKAGRMIPGRLVMTLPKINCPLRFPFGFQPAECRLPKIRASP
jgi:hypothetical protein